MIFVLGDLGVLKWVWIVSYSVSGIFCICLLVLLLKFMELSIILSLSLKDIVILANYDSMLKLKIIPNNPILYEIRL